MPLSDRQPHPLSATQHGIWVTERAGGLGTVFSMPFAVTLTGDVDQEALRAACRTLVRRHPVLGCAVRERAGVPGLVPAAVPPVPVTVDLREDPQLAAAVEEGEIRRPFDLEHGPLVRFTLLRTADDTVRLLVVAHHLVFDGRSTSILLDDLALLYAGKELPDLPPDGHPDDAEDRIAELLSGARDFWRTQPAVEHSVQLPGLRSLPEPAPRRAGDGASAGAVVIRDLDDALRRAVAEACAELGLTVFQFTAATWLALLHRYGNPTPVLGVDLGTRRPADLERIGAHVNELPLTRAPHRGESFRDFAQSLVFEQGLRSDLRGLYRYREVPLARALPGVRPGAALVPVTLGYRRREAPPGFPGAEAMVDWALPNGTSRGALRIHMVDGPDAWRFALNHDPQALAPAFAERIADHWCALAAAVAARPDALLDSHDLAPEETVLRAQANATEVPMPPKTVGELVADQASRTPDRVAVEDGSLRLTYRQLQQAVAATAGRLSAAGARPGGLVALALPRSAACLVAQLAVLRCGAAYVPLDPQHPSARLALQLEDCRPDLLLALPGGADALPASAHTPLLVLDPTADLAAATAAGTGDGAPGGVPGGVPVGRDRAYVLHTSGSTGRPKGVEIEHRALVNLLLSFRSLLGDGDGGGDRDTAGGGPVGGGGEPGREQAPRWLALTSPTFDISALECYLPLIDGGRVVFAPPGAALDGRATEALVRERGITHVQATPSGWQLLLEAGVGGPGLTAVVGGEALAPVLAAELTRRCGRVLHAYGPTETTVWSTVDQALPTSGAPVLGRPIANTTVQVLDRWGRPVPAGVPGELWIGGAGLARGYLGRPGATADRFRPDPDGAPGARRYRTGDLVCRGLDGRLVFSGRLDGQVKIRGHRVETGEIESALLALPEVVRAAVVAHDGPAGAVLTAFVVAVPAEPSSAGLRAALSRVLPAVMLPERWRFLDRLPLTAAGKVDRVALGLLADAQPHTGVETGATPGAEADTPDRDGPAPGASVPAHAVVVREIWAEVLGVPAVDLELDEDLFELGGHSLTVARIAARISDRLGVDLPLHQLYDEATVRGMALAVARIEGGTR
ncbi:non-ribosomal peptide synthetase [Streptacidiphilus jiangxiensis]|uniref:Amino acid adenylation domain-containing protein n=1 Tax=Streptacidiphilus jiangxiensis TaxID=235985 RepID=A0A1H7PA75_STRJI|nr:non-ribosomal peptide synthetase [Streptacidiphilus jiangxiensis]SEL32516.1 amino acid adenylation domain-containing protein [Streptacidiphilus jiangxiensis]